MGTNDALPLKWHLVSSHSKLLTPSTLDTSDSLAVSSVKIHSSPACSPSAHTRASGLEEPLEMNSLTWQRSHDLCQTSEQMTLPVSPAYTAIEPLTDPSCLPRTLLGPPFCLVWLHFVLLRTSSTLRKLLLMIQIGYPEAGSGWSLVSHLTLPVPWYDSVFQEEDSRVEAKPPTRPWPE